jgi:hypothetical protein
VTREQLLKMGVSRRTIGYWVATGLLLRVHAGVYAVGHIAPSGPARAMAAVLACGPQAVLSHWSAAALWGLSSWPSMPDVTAPRQHRRPGIHTHRSITLTRTHVTTRDWVPVTTVARTITDLAPRLTDRQLVRMVNDARIAKHLRATQLARLLAACPRAAALVDPAQNPTRSSFEDDFLAFLARYDLPTPQINVVLNGYEVDALFEAEKLIVECDGWEFHSDHESFEDDRERDAVAAEHGYQTYRLTHRRFVGRPAQEAARLREVLDRRRRLLRAA